MGFTAAYLLIRALVSLNGSMAYFSAPKITDETGFVNYSNKIVWLYGSLTSQDGESAIWSPYSETSCLYYRCEKLQGSWKTDNDGESYQEWTIIESTTNVVDTVLCIGTRKTTLDGGDIFYYNLQTAVNIYKQIDGIDYNFREYSIPLETNAWVAGKLEDNRISKTDKGLFVSLLSPDPLFRYFWGDSILILFFSILCFIAAAGFTGVLIKRLLKNKRMFFRLIDIGMIFLSLGLFWILTGLMYLSFSQNTLLDRLLTGIAVVLNLLGFIIPPLAVISCRPRLAHLFIFFPTAIGLVILGSYFLYSSIFSFFNWLFLILYIFCLMIAVILVQIYRLIFAKEDI